MQNEELGEMINKMAEELIGQEDIDTVQIVVTSYDPVNGQTYYGHAGRGNKFARKQILQELVDSDFDSNDCYENEDEEGFGETD